ncbi:diacylglycerol kinase family protein [Streptomyces sp. NPDC049099]|uniref:bifunctional phosphatase PAP2/diacylglycerol kinase family protein n=1 Tax=Streptomyces sp. NPDC049099 TaxID=3155768 RepID=UPI00342ADB3D
MSDRARHPIRNLLRAADQSLFQSVAAREGPAAETVLPSLSRSANHGLLWGGVALGMWALAGVRGRRAAVRGVTSLALASVTVNTIGKRSVGRARPALDAVPVVRSLSRRPFTGSFPSGHAASAAAFVSGVALESPRWGAALAPLAASVAFSRVYTGVHRPGDVLAGAALGVGAAYAVRGMVPSRSQMPPPARPRAGVPALPEGEGLVVVVNPSSGSQPQLADPIKQLRTMLPQAQVVLYDEEAGPLPKVLAKAAREAANRGGALGVCGGDGTVNAAATAALTADVPLMVLPGGTFNHFAADLGVDTVADACTAVMQGSAVRTDVGRIRPLRTTDGGTEPTYFLNTFSIGVYPELVRLRERWAPRIGGPPATLLGVARILRQSAPMQVEVNGHRRSLWLLFAGNGLYRSVGIAPVRRHDLADGMLDVRVAHAGRFARTRLLAAACVGRLARTPFYAAATPKRLLISGLPEEACMAYDGEVTDAPPALLLDKLAEALTVYRPTSDDIPGSSLTAPMDTGR